MGYNLLDSISVSAMGMRAQGTRIRVVSENVANASTTGTTPGADPYQRQILSFQNTLDKELGVKTVEVSSIGRDTKTPFLQRYQPDHPAADENGIVKMPNVSVTMEMMDFREAQRSYEANLGMIEQSRTMINRTVDLLRG